METLSSFTAIDFETFTPKRSSACAIGLAKVVNGVITKKFYSLIDPIPDNSTRNNSHIHGITREMLNEAPAFPELWPVIKEFIGDDVIVCHNAEFENSVLMHLLVVHCIPPTPSYFKFFCTYKLTGLSLDACCQKHNISIGVHHDALDDAIACAKVYLAENGCIQTSAFIGGVKSLSRNFAAKKYDRSTLEQLDDSVIENKSTPFFHARTIITGVFDAYPNRNELGKKLQSLGADICTTISKKLNVVVVGRDAGPAKLRKIAELIADGAKIRVIHEPELISILS